MEIGVAWRLHGVSGRTPVDVHLFRHFFELGNSLSIPARTGCNIGG